MRYFMSLLLLVAALPACVTTTRTTAISIKQVERPAERAAAEFKVEPSGETEGQKTLFEDDLLKIEWLGYSQSTVQPMVPVFAASSLGFTLQNKSDSTMRIIWDGASFVSPSGENSRVIHSGVRFIEKNKEQAPSVITKGGSLTDTISPSDGLYWNGGRWVESDFLGNKTAGKTVKVLLPIEVNDKTLEYLFEFDVLPIEPAKKK